MQKLRIRKALKPEQRFGQVMRLEHRESVGNKAGGHHSHSVAHPGDPLHIIFWGMCTMVALLWATHLRAERRKY